MDMQSAKVDPVKIEKGDWVGEEYGTPIPEMGDLCLQVRGIGNAAWRRLQQQLIAAIPRAKRAAGRLDIDEQDRINAVCLRDAGVTGWKNLTDGGKDVPYSKEAANSYLTDPQFRAFRDAALWACTIVGEVAAADVEADVKN